VILSNDTIKEQDERRLFSLGGRKFDITVIYHRTARGQFARCICTNGPAIWGGCVTRRSIRQLSWYPPAGGPRNCPGARRVWHVFLQSWYNFYCVLARSRYNFDRSRVFIPGYKVGREHWRSVAAQS